MENVNDAQQQVKETITTETSVDQDGITLLSTLETAPKRGKKRKQSERDSDKKKIDLEQESVRNNLEDMFNEFHKWPLQINRYRNQQNISVVGRNVPNPIKTFLELPIDSDLKENIKQCGYDVPTPIQQQAIPVMLQVCI